MDDSCYGEMRSPEECQTVVAHPPAGYDGAMPNTGADSLVIVWLAIALLAIGIGALIASKLRH